MLIYVLVVVFSYVGELVMCWLYVVLELLMCYTYKCGGCTWVADGGDISLRPPLFSHDDTDGRFDR